MASGIGRIRACVCAALVLATAAVTCAHDFWIEPATFRPAVDEVVKIGLRVGERFQGEPVKRNAQRIQRFVAIDAQGHTRAIPGVDGADPAGMVRFEHAGSAVLAYESNRASIELPADQFDAYLREEGLEAIREQRARGAANDKPVREVYSRAAKALLCVGGAGGDGWRRQLGLPIELVPDADPCAAGDELPIRLCFRGKPAPDQLVIALNRDHPKEPLRARTDANGRVRLKLERGGVWLVKAVIMTAAPPDADAEWESFWASLTFETPRTPITTQPALLDPARPR
ncbi:MAG: DUF4198 domain-containing protein [Phycisphaerae bacterium]